jgi:antitoxin CptB
MTLPMSEPDLDYRRRRLLYRACHRGTHENDLLIGAYVRHHLDALDVAAIAALEEVLELPDAELADWLVGRRPVPPDRDCPMLRELCAFAHGERRW